LLLNSDLIDSFEGSSLKYYESDDSVKTTTASIDLDNVNVRYNGRAVDDDVELDGVSYTPVQALKKWLDPQSSLFINGTARLINNTTGNSYNMVDIYDYETIVAQDFYKEYMSKENSSYEEDKELWRNIFKSCFYDNEFFEEILENYSIHWTDNLAIVLTFVIKTIKFFDEKNGANQEILPQYQTLDTLSYANELYKDAVLNEEKYLQLIDKQTTAEWDIDRISLMDKTILQIALAEICTFPTIPIQVSINEYVELTKIYSDEKNAKFVNGVLDKISKRLLDEGSITKVKLVK
jgi:N utilization substance protein B